MKDERLSENNGLVQIYGGVDFRTSDFGYRNWKHACNTVCFDHSKTSHSYELFCDEFSCRGLTCRNLRYATSSSVTCHWYVHLSKLTFYLASNL